MKTENTEFFEALNLLQEEKGIPKDYMLEKIKAAIVAAVKRDRGISGEDFKADFDEENNTIRFYIVKEVVEEVENPQMQISLEDAKKISKRNKVGSIAEIEIETKNFGRIAAKIGKNVIVQAINEAVNGALVAEFESKQNEIISGLVVRVDRVSKNVILEVGRHELVLPIREQIPGEVIREGDRLKVYVVEAKKKEKERGGYGHEITLSRTHQGLVRRLLELEIPEIADGTVEILSIAREAGSRTKIAVLAKDENVDPIGACIGTKRSRINNILKELKSEKLDIIKYNPEMAKYVAAALSPAEIIRVAVKEEDKACTVFVPSDQLSLAIGKEGQNVRLAAKLTGLKIDIKAAE
ncbi:MAG: transcription termination factor NusA [Clostridia bacterium]